jgi:hypothetical protein
MVLLKDQLLQIQWQTLALAVVEKMIQTVKTLKVLLE